MTGNPEESHLLPKREDMAVSKVTLFGSTTSKQQQSVSLCQTRRLTYSPEVMRTKLSVSLPHHHTMMKPVSPAKLSTFPRNLDN